MKKKYFAAHNSYLDKNLMIQCNDFRKIHGGQDVTMTLALNINGGTKSCMSSPFNII